MQVYLFSGLGADKTVFQFLDLSFCEPVFIEWLPPGSKESLREYALRLKTFYAIPDNGIIIGLSFGGMLATEIALACPLIKAVLISSAKTRNEIPAYYRLGKYLPMHQWSSQTLQRWFMLRIKWMFGITENEHKKVYEDLIRISDTSFNKWAVTALLNWDNVIAPLNSFHIHGTHDKILPYKYIQCDHSIQKGEHMMVMKQAAILSGVLKQMILSVDFKQPDVSSSENQPAHLIPV